MNLRTKNGASPKQGQRIWGSSSLKSEAWCCQHQTLCQVATELGAHCHRPTRPHNMGLLLTSALQREGRDLAGVARGRG